MIGQGTLSVRLEIKHLHLVRSICQTHNLTRAAEQLFLSQPALSKQLAELEDRLGFALFHRTRKAMLPTEAGLAFNRHAQRILDDVAALEDHLSSYGRHDRGRLRVSLDPLHHADWLPAWLHALRQRLPNVDVQIRQVPDLLHSLRQRESDLIVIGETSPAADTVFHPLNPDELVVILPPDHALGTKPWLEAANLSGQTLLYHFELEQSYLYRRYLHPQQIRLGSAQHIQDVPTIIALVRLGSGISVLPRRLLQGNEHGLLVRPIGEQGFHFNWYGATTRDGAPPTVPIALALLEDILSAAS